MCRSDGHIRDLCLVHADRKAAGGGRSIFTGGGDGRWNGSVGAQSLLGGGVVGGKVRWALNLYWGGGGGSWWNGLVGGQSLLGGRSVEWFGGRSIFTGGTVGGMVRWAVNLYCGGSRWNGLVGAQSLLGGGAVGGMVW